VVSMAKKMVEEDNSDDGEIEEVNIVNSLAAIL